MLLIVYNMFGERVFAVRKKNFNETLMRAELLARVGIAADYELNLLSDSLFSSPWSLLLHNRYGPWRAAASPGISVDLIHSCFSFLQYPPPLRFSRIVKVFFSPRENRRKVLANIITWISIN